jgi:hypothetical protein
VIVVGRKSIAVLGILTVALVWSPGHAALADGCDLLDLGCTIDAGVPTDTGQVVDDVTGTVDDVLGGAEDAVEPVVDPVIDVIEDVLGGGGSIEPPGGGDPGDGPADRPDRTGDHREGDRSGAGEVPGGPTALQRDPAQVSGTTAISAISGEARSTDRGGSGGFVADALRGVLLMVVLFAISIGFVLVQDLLDRNDPKLAVAAVRPEVVMFA